MTIRGRRPDSYWSAVLGSPRPRELAQFYAELLGWSHDPDRGDESFIALRPPDGQRGYLSFQLEPDHVPPVWPATAGEQQMQVHLDLAVSDVSGAVTDALALGARLADVQPQADVRVLLDPDGHPFCLWLDQST